MRHWEGCGESSLTVVVPEGILKTMVPNVCSEIVCVYSYGVNSFSNSLPQMVEHELGKEVPLIECILQKQEVRAGMTPEGSVLPLVWNGRSA